MLRKKEKKIDISFLDPTLVILIEFEEFQKDLFGSKLNRSFQDDRNEFIQLTATLFCVT